jgi:hypothetical protein
MVTLFSSPNPMPSNLGKVSSQDVISRCPCIVNLCIYMREGGMLLVWVPGLRVQKPGSYLIVMQSLMFQSEHSPGSLGPLHQNRE